MTHVLADELLSAGSLRRLRERRILGAVLWTPEAQIHASHPPDHDRRDQSGKAAPFDSILAADVDVPGTVAAVTSRGPRTRRSHPLAQLLGKASDILAPLGPEPRRVSDLDRFTNEPVAGGFTELASRDQDSTGRADMMHRAVQIAQNRLTQGAEGVMFALHDHRLPWFREDEVHAVVP